MKKTSFFYYFLIIGLFIISIFNACKDDEKTPILPPKYDFESKSFGVTILNDSLAGNYLEYAKSDNDNYLSLMCSYIVHNKTQANLDYNIKLEKIQTNPNHYIKFCIGKTCNLNELSVIPDIWYNDEPLTFVPNGNTNPYVDSYVEMWSGLTEVTPGLNKFKLTYTNVKDPTDFVSFYLIFNFTTD